LYNWWEIQTRNQRVKIRGAYLARSLFRVGFEKGEKKKEPVESGRAGDSSATVEKGKEKRYAPIAIERGGGKGKIAGGQND